MQPNKKRWRSGPQQNEPEPCCARPFLVQVMWFFNTVFWMSGLILLAVGLWALITKGAYTAIMTSPVYDICVYLVVAIAVCILAGGILGCVAVGCKNWPLLMIYAVLLLLVFVAEAVTGVIAYLYHYNLQHDLYNNLNHTVFHTYPSPGRASEAMDSLQYYFKCCGLSSHRDWEVSAWHDLYPTVAVPDSCCISPSLGCGERAHPSNIYYDTGCAQPLEIYLKLMLLVMGATTLGFCLLQLFGVIFSCCLAKAIQKYKKKQKTDVLLW